MTKIIFTPESSFYFAANFTEMCILFYLILISLSMAVIFLFAFFWAVRDGQYDDDYTPGMRILVDDDMVDRSKNPTSVH